jgi:hypothetical protein
MSRHSRTKLVPPKMELENQVLEALEEPILPELDMETECPRCSDIMELQSNFDELMYSCASCNFLLKCI